MEDFPIRWGRATEEVRKLLEKNLSYLNENLGISSGRKTKIVYDSNGESGSSSGEVHLNLSDLTVLGSQVVENLNADSPLWHDAGLVRNFGEIVKDGPRNDKEASLLFTASLTLSPEDLKNCVDNNLSVDKVMSKISTSRGLEAVKELTKLVEEKKEMAKETPQQQPEVKEPAKDPIKSFGEGFGILPKVSEELNKPIVSEKPVEQEKEKPKAAPEKQDEVKAKPSAVDIKDIKEIKDILGKVEPGGVVGQGKGGGIKPQQDLPSKAHIAGKEVERK